MQDKFRTKEQLLNELAQLRQHIDELEKSQPKFSLAKEKGKNILENSVEGLYQATPQGRFVSANSSATRLLGHGSPEESIGTLTDLPSQVYAGSNDADDVIRLLKTHGVAKSIEIKYYKEDGGFVWGLHNARLVRDHEDNILLWIEGTFQDIAERKRTEEALTESEHLFRDLAEKSLVGVYLIQDRLFRYVNSRFAEILGYEPHELIETIDYEETIHPDDRPRAAERNRKRASGEIPAIHDTFRILTKKGEVRNVEFYGSRIIYRGRPAVIGTLLDITERVRAEELLKEAEERYRGIFENAVEGIFLTAPSHELMAVNDSLVKIYGYDAAEEFIADLEIRKTGLFVRPSEHEQFFRRMHEDGYLRGFETEQYRKDGSRIWVSFNLTPIKGADGSVLRHVGTVTDITERKQSEERLRRSEAGLRALISSMNDVITLVDKHGRYTTLNLESPDMLNASLAGHLHEELKELVPGETASTYLAAVRKTLSTRRTVHIEYRLDAQGDERWVSAAISPMTKELAVSVARDITDLKRAESELRAKSLSLEETNSALRALLRNMEGAKKEVEEDVVSNIRVLVMPHVARLARCKLASTEKVHVDAIEAGLKNVAAPFLRNLGQFGLTPTEIQVANYVRDGRTTKEIIELMHGTKDSIDMHRYHIRRKLGINKTKKNLRSYLLSLH